MQPPLTSQFKVTVHIVTEKSRWQVLRQLVTLPTIRKRAGCALAGAQSLALFDPIKDVLPREWQAHHLDGFHIN